MNQELNRRIKAKRRQNKEVWCKGGGDRDLECAISRISNLSEQLKKSLRGLTMVCLVRDKDYPDL